MLIRCCKDCVPPKRQIGCHSTCKQYLEEKAKIEESRNKQSNSPVISKNAFNMLSYASRKRK